MSGTIHLTQRFVFYLGLIVVAIVCYTLGFTTPLVGLVFVGMTAEILFWPRPFRPVSEARGSKGRQRAQPSLKPAQPSVGAGGFQSNEQGRVQRAAVDFVLSCPVDNRTGSRAVGRVLVRSTLS